MSTRGTGLRMAMRPLRVPCSGIRRRRVKLPTSIWLRGLRTSPVGLGTLTSLLVERGARVCAIDFSSRCCRILETNVARDGLDGVSIHHGTAEALPFRRPVRCGASLFGLMFFPDRTKGYAEMFRTLRKVARLRLSSARLSPEPLVRRDGASFMTRLDSSRRPPTYDLGSLEIPTSFRRKCGTPDLLTSPSIGPSVSLNFVGRAALAWPC